MTETRRNSGQIAARIETIVQAWMHEYRRYLLDGDPQIVHPKAKAGLILALVEAFGGSFQAVAPRPARGKKKPAANDASARGASAETGEAIHAGKLR